MNVLFDQGAPAPLRKELVAQNERGWSALQNGDLIAAAEAAGFEVFITTDQNLKYQQSLEGRQVAIVVLLTTSWPRIRQALPAIVQAVDAATPETHREVSVPRAACTSQPRQRIYTFAACSRCLFTVVEKGVAPVMAGVTLITAWDDGTSRRHPRPPCATSS